MPSCQISCWPYLSTNGFSAAAGVIRGVSQLHETLSTQEQNCCFWWTVHLKMEKGILALSFIFLLILAAEGSAGVSTGHRLRPHLQIQEEIHGQILYSPSLLVFVSALAMIVLCWSSSGDLPLRDCLDCSWTEGKKDLEIQSPSRKKLEFGLGLGHEVRTVEMKHHRRMVTGHKGGSMGGGAGAGGAAGGRNVGGGGAVTRPHNNKNGAAALPVPVAFVLSLALGCGVVVSAFGFWNFCLLSVSADISICEFTLKCVM